MPPVSEDVPVFHRLTWQDFDALARLEGDAEMLRRLRRAERSRRKLLLHALMETAGKIPGLFGPLPPIDEAWELLARVEARAPRALDRLLTHPYTGSWAGYTTRLLRNRIDGVGPLWMHLGHIHSLAVAAAVRGGLDFEAEIPVWEGHASLPTLGVARLPGQPPASTAVVRGRDRCYVLESSNGSVVLPDRLDVDSADWWPVRLVRTTVGSRRFFLRLDDLDPYRGLYEPVPPQRLAAAELEEWRRLIGQAWQLIVTHLPRLAEVMPIGLVSLVPRPQVLFENPSASTGEAFGSAVVGRPSDGASLAATLVHEFQHIVLGGVLHLTRLYGDDPRERFYVPWRDDPRPLGGALQGVYAFFGVTAFWRALAAAPGCSRRAAFEFAYWRRQSWRTLLALRDDPVLTDAGSRFLDGMAECLGRWQGDSVDEEVAELATAAAFDHHAGWRLRHLRPDPALVDELSRAWLAGRARPPAIIDHPDPAPTPVPDGPWSSARTDLLRLGLTGAGRSRLLARWRDVPGATEADFAYATGQWADAARGYRSELAAQPDRPASLVGLGLALAASGPTPGGRALLRRPELVRAVHRTICRTTRAAPTPEAMAEWLGQLVAE
jgi:HEXXH motif-containing protein